MLFRSSVYVQGVDGGAARRLPIAGDPPSLPGWSPDGTRLAYVTWSEQGGGAVWTIAADGASPPVKISDIPAFYSHAVFTPDGARLLDRERVLSGKSVSVRLDFGGRGILKTKKKK